MSSPLSSEMEQEFELENELSQELEHELEHEVSGAHELEHEHAQEGEHEAFFNSLAAMGDRGGRSQALRRIALTAARAALRAQKQIAPAIQGELETEFEAMPELELEFSPTRLAALPGQMEHMGHAAAEAETEQEAAEHFLPLIGLAAKFVLPKIAGALAKKVGGKLLGRVAGKVARKVGSRVLGQVRRQGGQIAQRVGRTLVRRVQRNVPPLNRAVANVARTLWRNKTTRPLLHAIPYASRRTMVQMARRAARGRPISPRGGVRLFARNTARYIANPRLLSNIYRRSVRLDSRYHRHNRRIIGHPTPGVMPTSVGSVPSGGYPYAAYGQPVPGMPGMCTCPCQANAANYIPAAPVAAAPVPSACPSCGRTVIG
jgi:hypothetical protein